MEMGNRMKAARMKAGLTQSEAARLIGISRQTLSNWENERTYADIAQLLITSQVYAVTVDDLLKGTLTADESPPKTASAMPHWLQLGLKGVPPLLYAILVVALCMMTWYTEVHIYRELGWTNGYLPGYLTVVWIFTLLPIATTILIFIVTTSMLWGKERRLVIGASQLVQIGVQYYWLYQASLFHYVETNRSIDYIGMLTKTIGISAVTLLIGVGSGLLFRFLKPKVVHWLKGLN